MIEQCKFRDDPWIPSVSNRGFKCNPIKGLPALKAETGDMFSIGELREVVCKSSTNGDCPAFKSLQNDGKRSQFARPIIDNRPLR